MSKKSRNHRLTANALIFLEVLEDLGINPPLALNCEVFDSYTPDELWELNKKQALRLLEAAIAE